MKVQYLSRPSHSKLAYIYTETDGSGKYPPVMFLGGYRSDMSGTKATWLEGQASKRGQSYVRFDYSGHGLSEGTFEEGTIGRWKDDALAILEKVVKKKTVLAGSSMGGWIALLLAKEKPELVHALIGIAAAPDFTEEIYRSLTPAQQNLLETSGVVHVENDYSDTPYTYTKIFYEEAKQHLLLRNKQLIKFPLHLIQGRMDKDVPWQTAERIRETYNGADIKTVFIEDGEHRLSRPEDLEIIDREIRNLSGF